MSVFENPTIMPLLFTGAGINGKLLVGLTAIDRSEFTEVVETFLGD